MSPCKNCAKKGCGAYHNECKLYLDWKKKYDKRKKEYYERKLPYRVGRNHYLRESTFKGRTHGMFTSHMK